MVTPLQPKTPHTIKIEFADEPVTSFGGLVLAEKAAARLARISHNDNSGNMDGIVINK